MQGFCTAFGLVCTGEYQHRRLFTGGPGGAQDRAFFQIFPVQPAASQLVQGKRGVAVQFLQFLRESAGLADALHMGRGVEGRGVVFLPAAGGQTQEKDQRQHDM